MGERLMERATEIATALFAEDPMARRSRCERCGSRESVHVRLLVTGGCSSCVSPRVSEPVQSMPKNGGEATLPPPPIR